MSSVYVDSSVFVALLLNESGSETIRKFLLRQQEIISSTLLQAELYAVARREDEPLELVDALVDGVALIFPDRELRDEYRELLASGYCRGADLFHLACFLYIDPQKTSFQFYTLDEKQRVCAHECGIKTVRI